MDFTKDAMFFLSVTVVFSFFVVTFTVAAVYKVGDDAGWTNGSANVDYHNWAANKNFWVGDILVFQYDRTQNNVVRVSLPDYHKCNAANPIKTYSSGNDSITIMGPGHYYYICGFPGHCQTGQKVDIRVPKVSGPINIPTGSPSLAPTAASSTTSVHVVAPSPAQKSNAPSLFINNGLRLGLGLCLTLFMIVIGQDYVL